jgi:uncharacterized membrane protein YhiD involved in acid resistance
MRRKNVIVVICVTAVLLTAAALVLGKHGTGKYSNGSTVTNPASSNQQTSNKPDEDDNPITSAVSNALPAETGPVSWAESAVQITLRLLIAVILAAVLAFRPRKDVPLFRRSLFVSQTQILLSVVAAALMMVVGDNTARAFAIFAAASLVRFRTNIRDPKEITVLLISLALGLAAGVGRWELGVALCLFALALLWVLEYNESEQVVRAMELTVKTKDTDRTHEILKKIFKRMRIDAEVREIEPPDEKKGIGSIVYYMNLRLKLSTDYLSDRILGADTNNIEGIQWSKSKGANDIYQ